MMKRINIKAILANPIQRREMQVGAILFLQHLEGIMTTRAQAEAAFDSLMTPYVPPKGRRYTMICGVCEYEWDAESKRLGRRFCPRCGCDDACEDHVIRDERGPCT